MRRNFRSGRAKEPHRTSAKAKDKHTDKGNKVIENEQLKTTQSKYCVFKMIFLPYILHFYIISSNSLYIHTHKHIHIYYTGGVHTANSSVWENNGRRFLTSSLSIIASQRREFYCWSSDFTKKKIQPIFVKQKYKLTQVILQHCRTKNEKKI